MQQWNNNGTLFLLPYTSSGTSVVTQNWVNTGQPYATAADGTPGLIRLDINGDGNMDLIQQWNNEGILYLMPYMFDGTTYTPGSWINTGMGYGSTPSGFPGLIALDINGDGKGDLVQQWDNNGTLYLMPYFSDGTNLNATNWINTGQPYTSGPGGTPGLLALDINGDGKTDLVQQQNNNGTLCLLPYISNGYGFQTGSWLYTGQGYGSGPAGTPGLLALDINGDGLGDLVQQWNNGGYLYVLPYLSNGTTFVAQNWVNTGQGYGSALSGTPGLLALDVNGDGKTDLVQQWNDSGSLNLAAFISNGTGFSGTSWTYTGQGYISGPAGTPGLLPVDVNGDGRVDILHQWNSSGSLNLMAYSFDGSYFDAGTWVSTGQGYGSGPAGTPGLLGGNYLNPVSPLAMAMVGTVVLNNVTNPNWGANFNVGDTLQVIISGAMPNQPVYVSDSVNGTSTMGTTDGNGNFTYVAVEQTSNVGSYTQVWTVGNITASPALSYIVGQLGNPGTVTTTDTKTPDGNLEGISTLSITNGVVSTYSATELDYTSSLYYESSTAATLFDNGNQVSSLTSEVLSGNTTLTMTANATAWDDYDLQTDHYAVAYLVSGDYYLNPFDWGDDCEEATGDCSIDGIEDFDYYLTAQTIYLGSTLADQTNVPQDGSVPVFSDQYVWGFLGSGQTPPSGPAITLTAWEAAVAATIPVLKLAASQYRQKGLNYPLPLFLELDNETSVPYVQGGSLAGRTRVYIVKDTNGLPWAAGTGHGALTVFEKFIYVKGTGGMPNPNNPYFGGGGWSRANGELTLSGSMSDQISQLTAQPEVDYLQFFWASGILPPGFSLPAEANFGLIGYQSGPQIPLFIRDHRSKCKPGDFSLQGIELNSQFVGINGDTGPGTPCRN